ncbi:MAG: HD domain-containing protein [Bacteroidales bacterium]
MDELKKRLKTIESTWLKFLFNQLKTYFSEIDLPSHDHWHHYRVWQFAKIILYHLAQQDMIFTDQEITNLMLACLFHDAGMTQTLDETHGEAGAHICRKFIESGHTDSHINFAPALEAIKKHDDKQYNKTEAREETPSILFVLSTADDLDAFGVIGIIRYAEIYMLRNTNIEDIPDKVIKNAGQRFQHFMKKFRHFKELTEQQKERYEVLVNFYGAVRKRAPLQDDYRNILLHIQNNIKNQLNNSNLTDLLRPVDSETIKNFTRKVVREEQQFIDYSRDQIS